MTTLWQLILETINEYDFQNSIVILKGFNKWLSDISGNFLFSKKPDIEKPKYDGLEVLRKLSEKTGNVFMLYEDLVVLSDMSLAGVLTASGRNIIILNNDYFDVFYPSDITLDEFAPLKELHEKENDSYIQQIYGDIEESNGNIFIAYNDVPAIFDPSTLKNIDISTIISDQISDDDNDKIITIPDEFDAVVLSSIVLQVAESDAGKVSVLSDSLENDWRINSLSEKFKRSGIKVVTRSFKTSRKEIDKEFYDAYLEILQRKNPSYDFRTLKIYDNPYEDNDLVDISQSIIIDDIVQNAIRAMNKEPFRDVFVTAPTGAGKSVMFQIPAIYLAEKYDMVTLVISPLIGLMNDQVENIKIMTDKAATINSDYTPLQKEDTLNSLKQHEKSILYLSPEALLSNTDITSLIGDRQIGLIVVDEAHIVATWGKSFRPDYWYLGDFINKLRNNSKQGYRFPIVTFTATSTFGGDDNMYHDIIESLKMTPNKYIGNVRRDDIKFDIKSKKSDHDYQAEKLETAIDSINKLADTNEKVLVYVPYTRHVDDIMHNLKTPEKAGRYHGGLSSGEKNDTLKAIVSGEKNVVVATKAFGMGIDIDDIKYVYHYAPTGNIADYVQEIGRAARKSDMTGVAMTDFYVNDFRYIQQLYGMSSIKNFQIKAVLRKIDQIYKTNGKRNFLVSPDDFSFAFADSRPEDIDAKLKTTLLMIRKDFEADSNSTYPPLIFKPRSMFTLGYFMVHDEMIPGLKQFGYLRYFKKVNMPRTYEEPSRSRFGSDVKVTMSGDIYCLDYKSLWEDHYRDMSFSMFKHCFFENELKDFYFKVGEKIVSRMIIEVDAGKESLNLVQQKLSSFFAAMIDVLDDLKQSNKYFTNSEFATLLLVKGVVKKKYIADVIASSFIRMLERVDPYDNTIVKVPFSSYNSQTEKTILKTVSYEARLKRLERIMKRFIFGDRHRLQQCISPTNNLIVIILQIIEMLEIARCSTTAGEKPEFFIRVNNAYAIEKVLNNPDYVSRTVANVGKKHSESCVLMQHFFMDLTSDTARWDFIERFFLGKIDKSEVEQLKEKQRAKK